jgi:hypothetical protein
MALAGCLLALGLTACDATQLTISWADSDSNTMTVPAGFKGQLKVYWSGNGQCYLPKAASEYDYPVVSRTVEGFTGDTSGHFYVQGVNDGQAAEQSFYLNCTGAQAGDPSSNVLRIQIDLVSIEIQDPGGAGAAGMIQTSIDNFATYGSTECNGTQVPACLRVGAKGQQARVMFKPPTSGQRWWTGTCPASAATFVVRPGDQVDGAGYARPACQFSVVGVPQPNDEYPVETVTVRAVTPLAVTVSGPGDSPGLYGIRVGSADAGGFRPAAEACASTRSTSCTAKVVPGDTVTVGLKPPTEAGVALQATCPSGATFQIISSSATDVDGYATACPSFTPSDSTTDISVQKVPVRSLTVTGPADRPGLFGIAILSAPPGGSNVTRTVCTDTTKACTATFPAGGNVIAGFKPPSEGTLVGTCPGTGSAFTVTAASWTDDSGYHFPCPQSITPSVNSTTLSVQYVAPPPPPPPPSTVTVTVTGPCYGVSCDDTQLTYAYGVKVGDSVCTNSAGACSATVAAGSSIRIGIQPPTGSPGGWNVFPGDCPGGGRFSITTLSEPLEGGYFFEPCLTFTPGTNTTISIGRS